MGLIQGIQSDDGDDHGDGDGDSDDDDEADAWCQCVSGPGESLSIQNWPYPPTTSTRYTSLPNTQIHKFLRYNSQEIHHKYTVDWPYPPSLSTRYISLKPPRIHNNHIKTQEIHLTKMHCTMKRPKSLHYNHLIHNCYIRYKNIVNT